MDDRRLRFVAALLVYLIWVASLGVLAAVSGQHPPQRPSAVAPR